MVDEDALALLPQAIEEATEMKAASRCLVRNIPTDVRPQELKVRLRFRTGSTITLSS